MNELRKVLAKLTAKEKKLVTETIEKIAKHSFEGLNVEKLKGTDNAFRVRKGDFRILYYLKSNNEPMIIAIKRRSEKTYKKF
jgi:mRNA-degrading endonuclease RelE of RelBE toxin-antitoxin system